jgi:hypothetical protein
MYFLRRAWLMPELKELREFGELLGVDRKLGVEQRSAGVPLNSPTNFHNFPKHYAYPRNRND